MSSERPVPVRVAGIAPFELYLHEREDRFISAEIRANAIWEPLESSLVLGLLKRGSVFVDLGANIGYYTVLAAQACGPQGHVYAFEPEPANFGLLALNVEHNDLRNVTCVNAAAARASGESRLYLSDFNQGDHRLYDNERRPGSLAVKAHALDDWFRGREARIDLVKMDTQGSEVQILEGMDELLRANRGRMSLILEYWPFGLAGAGDTPERMVEILAPYDFDIHAIDEAACALRPATWESLLADARGRYHPDTQGFTNLLLRPRR